MNHYEVRIPGGAKRFASASSKLSAAELALGAVSPRPPAHDPERPPACFVKEKDGSDAEEPFWHAEGEAEADGMTVEDLNASNDE